MSFCTLESHISFAFSVFLHDPATRRRSLQPGDQAEANAFKHLQQAGLKLIERNYRCHGGELELLMLVMSFTLPLHYSH